MATVTGILEKDLEALRLAHARLEHPSLAIRLTSALGTPVEQGARLLPRPVYEALQARSHAAVERMLEFALWSLQTAPNRFASARLHRALGVGSGAIGGLFGLPALLLELPVSTVLMLRAIADTARQEGESLEDLETRLACAEVFALGGRSPDDDAAEAGYYGVRVAMARYFSSLAHQVAKHGLAAAGSPAAAHVIANIAARFGVAVSNKAVAQMVPVVGAAAGATVNLVFMQHFQSVAEGHFTIRRLERTYGVEVIEAEYVRMNVRG